MERFVIYIYIYVRIKMKLSDIIFIALLFQIEGSSNIFFWHIQKKMVYYGTSDNQEILKMFHSLKWMEY